MDLKEYVIGVDLGTSTCCAGICLEGKVHIIPNDQGERITPSYVAFTDTEILVGEPAMYQSGRNLNNTIYNFKRLLGRRFNDKTVQEDIKYLLYKVIEGGEGEPLIQVTRRGELMGFRPEEITAVLLKKLRRNAETYLGQCVRKAVITVPACFDGFQRQAVIDAAKIAGLSVIQLLNDPSAVAIAYQLEREEQNPVIVVDIGGGTFDVSYVHIDDHRLTVLRSTGDSHLGGEDFNARMMDHLIAEIKKEIGIDLSHEPRDLYALRLQCECVKKTLSCGFQAPVSFKCQDREVYRYMNRAQFEALNAEYLDKYIDQINLIRRSYPDVNEIVLVGGSSRIPVIRQLCPKRCSAMDPDEAVAQGAAIYASILNEHDEGNLDIWVFSDVTPSSLNLKTSEGEVTRVISQNTALPVQRTCAQITTSASILENDEDAIDDSRIWGQFEVAPERAGDVHVTLTVDCNGIPGFGPTDRHHQSMNMIGFKGQLSQPDIDRMRIEWQNREGETQMYRTRSAAKYLLEQTCYDTSHTLRSVDVRQIISKSRRMTIKAEVDRIMLWLHSNPDSVPEEFERYRLNLESLCGPINSVALMVRNAGEDLLLGINGLDKAAAKEVLHQNILRAYGTS